MIDGFVINNAIELSLDKTMVICARSIYHFARKLIFA